MIFDYYKPFFSTKANKWVPGVSRIPLTAEVFEQLLDNPEVETLCQEIEQGEKDKKLALPAICWTGKSTTGKRVAKDMLPTQYFMVDVDHCDKPREAWLEIVDGMIEKMMNPDDYGITLVHVTPSGKGLRIVAKCKHDYPTLSEHMKQLSQDLNLAKYGDVDEVVKDLSRLSFAVPRKNIILFQKKMFEEEEASGPISTEEQNNTLTSNGRRNNTTNTEAQTEEAQAEEDTESKTQVAQASFKDFTFNGFLVSDIAKDYVKHFFGGRVEEGRKHAAYNQMVKDFRHICNNDPAVLYALLPRFEPTNSDRLSQCQSICKTNNIGTDLPPKFEIFLIEYGYIPTTNTSATLASQVKSTEDEEDIDEEASDEYKPAPLPKKLPPVFREILATCPNEFIVPCVNALLPVMGTLTSYLRATYPSDQREHSTEFFSVIYAPPSTGKGFVERFLELLTRKLQLRDDLTMLRDAVYNSVVNKKGSNEKAPTQVQTQCRLMPARNSLGEVLKKMVANKGHHVLTYAAEIDEWSKGVKAAGGDKDDLMRIAWDNGEYGQMFQASNTFKGKVRLYWNVLMCGTPGQMFKYFKNTENGLVSRASFTEIKKINFGLAPQWKALGKPAKEAIRKFRDRSDNLTYGEPLEYKIEDAYQYTEDIEAYDREVPFMYQFKPFTRIDLNWLYRELVAWQKVQNKINAGNLDYAADEFIPRVMVRGFRLGLLCYGLWDKVGEKEKQVIKDFVLWWMAEDMHEMCKAWSDRRPEVKTKVEISQLSLIEQLPEVFTRTDVAKVLTDFKYSTPVKVAIYNFKQSGLCEKIAKNTWKKIK